MEDKEFEKFLYYLFKHQGFFAELTPDNGEFGANLVLQKGNQKIVVQAKRYSSKVGVDAIYEVLGGQAITKPIRSGLLPTTTIRTKQLY